MIDLPELMQQLTTLETRLHQMTQRAERLERTLEKAREALTRATAHLPEDRQAILSAVGSINHALAKETP